EIASPVYVFSITSQAGIDEQLSYSWQRLLVLYSLCLLSLRASQQSASCNIGLFLAVPFLAWARCPRVAAGFPSPGDRLAVTPAAGLHTLPLCCRHGRSNSEARHHPQGRDAP